MKAGYVINVGRERPEKVIVAHVNKRTGEPIQNTVMDRFVAVGTHLVINKCMVWGRRFIKEANGKKRYEANEGGPIEFNTPKYGGDIEFLKWGDQTGSAIEIRYLPQSRSLDVEYQDNIQRIRVDQDKGLAQLELGAGQNKFDYETDYLKVEFLKVHPQNRDSVSKNPNPEIKGFTYYEVTDAMVNKHAIDSMESMIEAGYLIKSLSEKPHSIRSIFDIMVEAGVDFGQTNQLSNDGAIYESLLTLAQNHGSEFNRNLEDYKKGLSDLFEYAKSHNALDLTKDDVIALEVEKKKEIILSNAEGKKGGQLDWVLVNFHEEGVYENLKKFKSLVSKL